MKILCISLLLLLTAPSFATHDHNILTIIHPAPESSEDIRFNYQWDLLSAALSTTKTEGPYELKPALIPLTERREIKELSAGRGIVTVIRNNASDELEDLLLPIKVPLLKGMMGWRIFLIHKDTQLFLSSNSLDLDELRQFSIGQGKGWNDIPILTSNGFNVVEATSYKSLFKMLHMKRFPLFSRGMTEAKAELNQFGDMYPNMAIEKHLILRYEYLEYFFVNTKDKALAARIERGLNNIIKNGTMDKLFDRYFKTDIMLLDILNRKVIDIHNTNLGTNPPLERKELFLKQYLDKLRVNK